MEIEVKESAVVEKTLSKKNCKALIFKRMAWVVFFAVVFGFSGMYLGTLYNKQSISPVIAVPTLPLKKIKIKRYPLTSEIPSWLEASTQQLMGYALPKKEVLSDFESEEQAMPTMALVDKVVVIPRVKIRASIVEPVAPLTAKTVSERKSSTLSKMTKKQSTKSAISLYAIQLLASHKIEEIQRFRKNNNLMNKTKIRHFIHAESHWYVLTLGEFDNKNKAQLQIKSLPAKLSQLNPWVRLVSGLAKVA